MYWSSMRSPVYGHVSISSQWAIIRSTLNRLNHQNIIMWVKSPCLSFLLQFLTVVEWCSKALLPTDCWLVVWNMNFSFPHIGNSHPKWRSYFFRGVGTPPTRYYWGWSLSSGNPFLHQHSDFSWHDMNRNLGHTAQFTITGLYATPFKWEICIYI